MKTVQNRNTIETMLVGPEVAMSDFDVVGTGFTVLDRIYADARGVAVEGLGGSCGNVQIGRVHV